MSQPTPLFMYLIIRSDDTMTCFRDAASTNCLFLSVNQQLSLTIGAVGFSGHKTSIWEINNIGALAQAFSPASPCMRRSRIKYSNRRSLLSTNNHLALVSFQFPNSNTAALDTYALVATQRIRQKCSSLLNFLSRSAGSGSGQV